MEPNTSQGSVATYARCGVHVRYARPHQRSHATNKSVCESERCTADVIGHFLPARRYASAALAMALCLSVCVCVCHKSVFCRNGWMNPDGFSHERFLPPILHLLKGNLGIFKIKGTSDWKFIRNSGLWKFCFGVWIIETCYRLRSTTVDAHSVINWTVVGQLSW